MTEPNMTLNGFQLWQQTDEFQDYRADYTGNLDPVLDRTRRVLAGRATASDREKVRSFISRMKAQPAGEEQYGSGRRAVSARTAALRNWGYDPTGVFR